MSDRVSLRYTGKAAVLVPDAGLEVQPGAIVPIPTDIAASLLERPDWERAEKKAPKESDK